MTVTFEVTVTFLFKKITPLLSIHAVHENGSRLDCQASPLNRLLGNQRWVISRIADPRAPCPLNPIPYFPICLYADHTKNREFFQINGRKTRAVCDFRVRPRVRSDFMRALRSNLLFLDFCSSIPTIKAIIAIGEFNYVLFRFIKPAAHG